MTPDTSVASQAGTQQDELRRRTNELFNRCGGPTHDCVDWKTLNVALTEAFQLGAALSASRTEPASKEPDVLKVLHVLRTEGYLGVDVKGALRVYHAKVAAR